MKVANKIVLMLGATLMLAGCSTTPPASRVNLFDGSDYRFTAPGEMVGDMVTRTNGIWLSRPAVERLQKESILP